MRIIISKEHIIFAGSNSDATKKLEEDGWTIDTEDTEELYVPDSSFLVINRKNIG